MKTPQALKCFTRPRFLQVLIFSLVLLTLMFSFAGWLDLTGRDSKTVLAAKARPVSPVREAIARKLQTQGKVKVELFVMSQCPFGVRAEEAIAPVLDEFGEQVDFQLRFIATPSGEGFASLHGQPEIDENIRQVVMAEQFPQQYFDYVVARAANYRSSDWQPVAAASGIDVKTVERLARSESGKRLFAENIRRGNELRVNASPTIFLDGVKYQGRVLPPAPAAAKTAGAAATPAPLRTQPQPGVGAQSLSTWQKWFAPLWTQASAAVQSGFDRLAVTRAQIVGNSRALFAGGNRIVGATGQALPAITATKSFTLPNTGCPGAGVFDLNCNGSVNPGDTLMYSVLLNNTGSDALNVIFTDMLNANLTFVPGSLSASPIGRNDSYTTSINKQLEVAATQTVSGAVFVNGSVRTNDIDPIGGTLTITPLANSPTAQGGTVTLSNSGTFLYTPPNNFAGTDTFIYTATNAQGKTDTAQATIQVEFVCQPNSVRACYTGPTGTQGVGICRAGTETCNATGTEYGACVGQVLSAAELCDGLDNDCNGVVDDHPFGEGFLCNVPPPPPAGVTTPCKGGFQQCVNGAMQCVGSVGPTSPTDGCGDDTNCDGALTNQPNLMTDSNNCGACGNVCAFGQVCNAGVCATTCGDGIRAGGEACDDSNTVNGDGCSATCTVESGYNCTGSAPSVCSATCGDGLKTGSEQCDDGNTVNGDGCSATCQYEAMIETEPNDTYTIASGPFSIPAHTFGKLLSGAINPVGDPDFYSFTIPAYADLQFQTFDAQGPGSCAPPTDTVLQLLATDGTTVLASNDNFGSGSCSQVTATHLGPGTYFVKVSPSNPLSTFNYTLQARYLALCGNNLREGSEECDGTPGCDASCNRIPNCGDGFIDAPETCDDGNTVSGDGCSSTCQAEVCAPGSTSACYSGPAGTAGVGACHAGIKTCNAQGTAYGACVGEVLPLPTDTCGVDANCDGALTNQPNLQTDINNCGSCGNSCVVGAVHSNWACVTGGCQFQGCQPGYYDLNGDHICEYACTFTSPIESCNGLDDNCNGQIDENVTLGQTPGDCQVNVCSGGSVASVPDNNDLPVDVNQCTLDVCINGVPSNPIAPAGTSCNQNGGTVCDGAGACIPAPLGTCANPKLVPNSGTYTDSGSTVGAENGATYPCGGGDGPDLVYTVTPTSTRTITANTFGSGFDTVLSVRQGSCTSPFVVCNDDAAGSQSQVSWNATAGVTYFVIVSGYGGATGNYVLNFSGLDMALNSAGSPQQNQLSQVPLLKPAGSEANRQAASLKAWLQGWLHPLFSAFARPVSYFNLSRLSNWAQPTVLAAEGTVSQPSNLNLNEAPGSAVPPRPTRTLLVNSKGEYAIVPSSAIPTSFAGETVTVNGNGSGFTLPASRSTTIMFKATLSGSFTGVSIRNQASVSGANFTTLTSNNLMTPVLQAPVISSNTLPIKAGSNPASFTIATAFDPDQAAHTLGITINGNPTMASSNGVTVSNVMIVPGGAVTANIATTCAATSATFNLVVTDSLNAVGMGILTVTVTPNMPPVLSYSSISVTTGTTPVINPATGPSDNGTVTALVLQSIMPNNGGLTVSVNPAGQVQVLSATLAGSYTVNLAVTDNCTANAIVPLTINVGCPPLTFNPASLPNGVQGTAYSQTLAASPAGGNYSYTLATGALPPGLTLASNGTLSGIPTAGGNYAFTVKATGWGGCQGTQSYNLLVTGTCTTITLEPTTLPGATLGVAYQQTLAASPADTYRYAVSQGALPNGLTLEANTGVLSGTPTTGGTFSFRVTATGAGGCTGSRNYVVAVQCGALTFLPASLPNGLRGTVYSQQLSVSAGGSLVNTALFSLLLGSLPPGFMLSNNGLLSGTTTQTGTYNFTVKAVNGSCQSTKAYTLVISSGAAALAQLADYDGDGKSDYALWANNGAWRLLLSNNSGVQRQAQIQSWGNAGDLTVQGDYDGDGKTDLAVFRPSNGTWYVKRSHDDSYLVKIWGISTDLPVPGDYDGDGKTDLAVFRPTEGNWYVQRSTDEQVVVTAWGAGYAPYLDVPVPSDYDGDGKTDLAVFRRATGTWLIKRSSDGQIIVKSWGLGSDVPVANDYDGDGQTDVAVWRSATGAWYIWQSTTNSYRVEEWGVGSAPYYDQVAPGDYDGDGRADLAAWRSTTQNWYIRSSLDGSTRVQAQGLTGDTPVAQRGH